VVEYSKKAGRHKQQVPWHIQARRMLQRAERVGAYSQLSPDTIATLQKIADFGHVPDEEAEFAWLELRTSMRSARASRRAIRAERPAESGG
jgi:hypothetical protein